MMPCSLSSFSLLYRPPQAMVCPWFKPLLLTMSLFATAIPIALPWSRPLPLVNIFNLTTVIPLLIVAVFLARSYIKKRSENPAGLPYPPGPRRLPIVGNLFGIKDLGTQWLTFAEWSKKYGACSHFFRCHTVPNAHTRALGDLLYLEILGQKILVINSEEIAEELLDKRSQIYSDRPQVPIVTL